MCISSVHVDQNLHICPIKIVDPAETHDDLAFRLYIEWVIHSQDGYSGKV
jgi:hypothetical protein